MSERPILFSGAMVRAILAGTKTQTRRLVTPSTSTVGTGESWSHLVLDEASADGAPETGEYLHAPHRPDPTGEDARTSCGGDGTVHRVYPRIEPGDTLWVREAHAWADEWVTGYAKEDAEHVCYKADGAVRDHTGTDFDPGQRYWPDEPHVTEAARWVQRWRPSIHMPRWASRLTLRVESVRVERLNAITSGDIWREGLPPGSDGHFPSMREQEATLRESFVRLWDSINGERAPWAGNPWVWVVSFSRVTL